ncbi:Thaumatin family - like 3, partial [Theobroma cacao]
MDEAGSGLEHNAQPPQGALVVPLQTVALARCGPSNIPRRVHSSNGGQDFSDVSLVDDFNLPVSITPQGSSGLTCTTTSCVANVNSVCPSELA